MAIGQPLPYLSSPVKLVRFFNGSRDQWKEKCKEAKKENKSLKTRLAAMRKSRDAWKAKARGASEELRAESAAVEAAAVEEGPRKN
jgi:hypothetical protein